MTVRHRCRTALALLCLALLALPVLSRDHALWETFDTSVAFRAFDKDGRSFDTRENLKYCDNSEESIVFDASVKDYHNAIQHKLDLLEERSGGGTLRLSEGTFTISNQLSVYSRTCLIGAGMNKTSIRVRDKSENFRRSGTVRTYQTERVTIMDLTIDGNRNGQGFSDSSPSDDVYGRYGFYSQLSDYLWLKGVRVTENYGYGFDPHGSKRYYGYFLVIENCLSDNNRLDGYTIDQTYFGSLLSSVAQNNGRHGVNVVTGSRYTIVRGNTFSSNGAESGVGGGMVAQNNVESLETFGVRFEKNNVFNSTRAGVILEVKDAVVSKNKITNALYASGAQCFRLTGTSASDVLLDSNTCAVKEKRKFGIYRDAKYNERNAIDKFLLERVDVGAALDCGDRVTGQMTGVKDSKSTVCCPGSCGVCGGAGCGSRGANCCQKKILQSQAHCDSFEPPCILGTGKVQANCGRGRGIQDKKGSVCCPLQCGICGGAGCGSRGDDGVDCCQKQIVSTGKLCAQHPPPCVLDRATNRQIVTDIVHPSFRESNFEVAAPDGSCDEESGARRYANGDCR